jgi:uncharacterized membrane protein
MEQKSKDTKKRPAQSYQSRGMAMGIALGLIFGLMFDQMAVGLVLGIAVGAGMGRTLELQAQKKRDEGT